MSNFSFLHLSEAPGRFQFIEAATSDCQVQEPFATLPKVVDLTGAAAQSRPQLAKRPAGGTPAKLAICPSNDLPPAPMEEAP